MADRNRAFHEVMNELKDHIRGSTAMKYHRRPKPGQEPDGDEDANGREYPGSPDDMTKPGENDDDDGMEIY